MCQGGVRGVLGGVSVVCQGCSERFHWINVYKSRSALLRAQYL